MRPLLVVFSLLFFLAACWNLWKAADRYSYSTKPDLHISQHLEFFEGAKNVPGYTEAVDRIRKMKQACKVEIAGEERGLFWLNAAVALLGLCSSVLSAYFATLADELHKKRTIWIAAISAIISFTGFFQGHLQGNLSSLQKKQETLSKYRETLFSQSETDLPRYIEKLKQELDDL